MRTVSIACALTLATAACGAVGDPTEAPIGSAEEQLANGFPKPWPRTSGVYNIRVCWKGGDPAGSGRARAEAALIATWQAVSAVRWNFEGTCPASPHADVVVAFLDFRSTGSGSSGIANGGLGARLGPPEDPSNQVHLVYAPDFQNFESMVTHEFGHVLGPRHEHGRAGYPAVGPTLDAWGCGRNADGTGNDPCGGGLDSSNNCIPHPVQTGPELTPIDTASIMAPWLCDPNRRGNANYFALSFYDQVGVYVTYPNSFGRSARGLFAFVTSSGLVTRTGDSLVTDYTSDGVLSSVFKTGPNWTRGSVNRTGVTFPVTNLVAGTNSVAVSFTDYLSRTHSGTTTVVLDDSKHADLLQSTLGVAFL